MGFHSPLDSILRLRRLLEERQESSLRIAQSNLNECEQTFNNMSHIERGLANYASSLQGVPAIDLHVLEMRRRVVLEMLVRLREKLPSLRDQVAIEHDKLMQVRQEREKLETLTDSARKLWLRQKARKEQLWLDEMFLMRRR
jgi:flagellar export protein FliJ